MSIQLTALGVGDAFSAIHYTSCLSSRQRERRCWWIVRIRSERCSAREWLSPCDRIVHEANLGPAHTPYEKLAALPLELRSRMYVTHLPDGYETTGEIEPLRQNARVTI
jgi:hypothetical protein